MDKTVGENPTDLLIMPHFAGAATPYMDTNSKAAILGLTFEHTKSDIYKALMEGTAYEIALNLQIDESICSMYDYFEIFLGRMMLCRKSAEILGTTVKRTFAIRFATCS